MIKSTNHEDNNLKETMLPQLINTVMLSAGAAGPPILSAVSLDSSVVCSAFPKPKHPNMIVKDGIKAYSSACSRPVKFMAQNKWSVKAKGCFFYANSIKMPKTFSPTLREPLLDPRILDHVRQKKRLNQLNMQCFLSERPSLATPCLYLFLSL